MSVFGELFINTVLGYLFEYGYVATRQIQYRQFAVNNGLIN